jgi:protein transport protein SEC61 subunit alpha
LVKFFLPILPEIESPIDRVSFDERVVFTIASAIIFLLAQFPVYGLKRDAFLELQDPLYSFRPIFAMEKGTLLELGLLPVVTSSLLWQLGAGLRLIKVNFNLRSDRELFQSGQKLTSFALAIVYTLGLIGAGYYNTAVKGFDASVDALGFPPVGALGLILLQVVGTSFIITLMVEVFDKGYGFGSGFLSFLALQAATNFVRDVISFESYSVGGPNEPTQVYGALASIAVGLKDFTVNTDSFARTNLPNLIQVLISAAAILVVIGFQNLRIELPIRSTKVRGMANVFPIRLLYTGVLPIIFAYAVLTNLQLVGYITSSLLTKFTSSFVISSILGRWEVNAQSHNLELTGGLLYLLSPASSLLSTIVSPIRSIVYSAVVVVLACWFGNIWANISGSAPRDIAKQFKEQGITIASKRDVSITKELSRVIPVASVSGAFVLAATAVTTDLLGGLGKGVALVVGVSAAFGVLEEFTMEFQQSGGGSQFGSAFGAK